MYLSANVAYIDSARNGDTIGSNRFAAIVTKVLPGGNVQNDI